MITGTIVLYNNDRRKLLKAITSFLSTDLEVILFLVDNSPTRNLENIINDKRVQYIYTGSNLGFGTGHNYVIDKIKRQSNYHVILNPDIYFEKTTLKTLLNRISQDSTIGIIAPKIIYPNGKDQHSIRKFPEPIDLVIRRVKILSNIFAKRYSRSHYLDNDLRKENLVESVSGCFMFFRSEVFINISGFDEKYFMYLEDIDICKKVNIVGKKILYFPFCTVTHYFEKGSSKSFKLLFEHIKSAIIYFYKWKFKL